MKRLILWYCLLLSVALNAQAWVNVNGGFQYFCNLCSANSACIYDGKLIIGGEMTMAGTIPVNCIASWDGNTWDSLSSGIGANLYGGIATLCVYDSVLYTGGEFHRAGNDSANQAAQWNGIVWDTLRNNVQPDLSWNTQGMIIYNNMLVTMGYINGYSHIIVWNGTTWDSLGASFDNAPWALIIYNNVLYVGGQFSHIGKVTANYLAYWNGTYWDSVSGADLNGGVNAFAVIKNRLYVGGGFTTAGGKPVNGIGYWNDTTWTPMSSGISDNMGGVHTICTYQDTIYAGGSFNNAGGKAINNVAKWDGSNWQPVGAGLAGNSPSVGQLIVYDSLLYAVGRFDTSGNVTGLSGIAVLKDTIITTGINEVSTKGGKVVVYPNPSNGIFTFQIVGVSQKCTLEIYNMLGENVYNKNINSETTQINLSNQPQGIYLYRITDEEGNLIKADKIIIER